MLLLEKRSARVAHLEQAVREVLARSRHRVHDGAGERAVLGVQAERLHLHFVDDVVVREHPRRAGLRIAGVDAVEVEAIRDARAAAEGRAVVDAGRVVEQVGGEASERQVRKRLLADVVVGLGGADVDDRRLGGNLDGVGQAAHLEAEVDRGGLADRDRDRLDLARLEAGERRLDRVAAGLDRGEAVAAVAVADGGDGAARAGEGDGGARQRRAALVGDRAGHDAEQRLGHGGHGKEQEGECGRDQLAEVLHCHSPGPTCEPGCRCGR